MMKGVTREANKRILFEAYKASAKTATILVGIILVIELVYFAFTFINPQFFGEYLTKYRLAYLAFFIITACYESANVYISKDFYNRFDAFFILNPMVTAVSFLWAITISVFDYGITGDSETTLYMTFSLAIPLCFYMDHIAYCVIAVIADAAMLIAYSEMLIDRIDRPSLSISYFAFFLAIQLFMGFQLLRLKRNLSDRIFKSELQKNEIKELSETQNVFFASMSHEIRTPINTIIGLDEMILRSSISDEVREDAENIQSAGKILLHLLNDLLDISKIETGMMELAIAPYRTQDMILELWGMLNIRAAEKGIKLNVEISPKLPKRLFADEVRLKQILINLINNAIKYTKDGSVTFKVECENDVGIEDVTYTVKDTGIGIPEESMPHIFTAYKRLNEDRTKYIEGTGLGLSIVKQLVELMNGEIQVDSIYGVGSVFKVRIPQRIADDEPIGEFSVTDMEKKETEVFRSTFEAPDARILIVDDTPANLIVARKLLRDTKVSIDTAENGAVALEMTAKKYYHVIFMDHFMPVMDGIECIKNIRKQKDGYCINSRIVVLTANVAPENEVEYIKAGFDGYLTKPITGRSIEEELMRQLPESMINRIEEKDLSTEDYEEDEDEELKESLRHIFISSIDETARKLDLFLKNEDIHNYTIVVHGLKSTAHLAGENDISQRAAALEKAGKDNDIDTISRLHAAFISDYLKCREDDTNRVREKTKSISTEELRDAYMTISEYAEAYDYTLADEILNQLDEYDLDEDNLKRLRKMRSTLDNMNYEELKKLALGAIENG